MTKPNQKIKVGATPGKMLLMAVLAVVFVSVLVFQFTASEEEPASQENADASGPSRTPRTKYRTSVSRSPLEDGDFSEEDRKWPKIALEEILQHDPFAVPGVLLPPAKPSSTNTAHDVPDKVRVQELQRQREQALTAIREQGVQMVFLGKDVQVAIIGDRRVRVGDRFEGFQVTDIDSDGITLSEQ